MAKDKPTPAGEPAAEEVEIEQPVPSGAIAEEVALEAPAREPAAEEVPSSSPPPTREYVVLNGPASFGPVVVNGKSTRARAGEIYHIPSAEERADVLATGVFRGATAADVEKAGFGSAGQGGPITLESLPPGALKGGLK